MKRTERELNTIIEDVTAEIRNEKLDQAVVAGAAQRVWARLVGEQVAAQAGITPVEHLRNCDDFQALIPAYLQGQLSSARTILLEDHTRECVPCRKALKEARQGNQVVHQLEMQKSKAGAAAHRMTVLRWGIAAAIIIGFGLFAWPWILRFTNSVGTLQAIVEAANGNVYRVAANQTQAVKAGEKLQKGERIRTSKNAGAIVKLSDGSLIEMRERSEFSVSESVTGTTINLDRGNIIVEAAKQGDGKLFVATDDTLVSVTGTIFSVNQGTKGARVSVIEGEVHVGQAGKDRVLLAGDQVTTHPSIERMRVQDEISWSANADRYRNLLDQAAATRHQIDELVSMPGNRYSTNLLDLMPENTVFYLAIPNLSETLAEANRILQENVQKNPELRAWWEEEQSRTKGKHGLNEAIDLAREFGSYLGSEIVVGAAGRPGDGVPEEPIVLAELKDAQGFRIYLESKLAGLDSEKKHVSLIDDPMTATAGQGVRGELFIWINDGLLAASPKLDSLKGLAARAKAQTAKPFASTQFYAHIADLYREGAGLVIAADLEKLVVHSIRREKDSAAAQQLGLLDLRYFVIEVKTKEGKPYNRAVVGFKENQHGITSWLAQPGPMGALEFISPDANIVAAFVVKDPTALVDDLLDTVKSVDADAWQKLQDFQAEQGIELRNDFAAPLGGEYAFAVDGPLLPMPSWKAVFQVDDPAHLQQTFERTIEKLNQELAKDGKQGFQWEQSESNGKPFYTLKSLDYKVEVNYAYVYGYLIACPSRALVENAIKYHDSGYTLLQSAKFKATLPEDKQANFSAMVYQNLAPVMAPIAKQIGKAAGDHGPKEAGALINGLLGSKAGLAYVYALNDRITFSINTEDGPVGLTASDLFGLPGSAGLGHILKGIGR